MRCSQQEGTNTEELTNDHLALRQDQVQGASQEHGQPGDVVCAVQLVDVAQTTYEHKWLMRNFSASCTGLAKY
jgi:hypothetical protein